MLRIYIAVKVLFLLLCCWMASSSSNALSEDALMSPKIKRDQVHVSLSEIRTEKNRHGDMYCIHGLQ
jgi:hypothetical protein